MNQYRDDTIRSRYGHGQLNTKHYRERVEEQKWRYWIQDWPAMTQRIRQIPFVKFVFPRIEFFALISNGDTTVSGVGQAVDGAEESHFFNALNIIAGVNLSDQKDGLLIGKGMAKALKTHPGDSLTVLVSTNTGIMNGMDFSVTGIFDTGLKDFDDSFFRIQLSRGSELLDTKDVESISIGLDSMDSWDSFAAQVEKQFPELEATAFNVLDEIYYQHSVDWLHSQFQVVFIIIVTIVFLGVLNSVTTSIFERKQEVGMLRANGESKSDVLRLFIFEGAALGVIGSLLGIAMTWILTHSVLRNGILMPAAPGQTRAFYTLIELQVGFACVVFLTGVLAAVLGTFVAGLRITKLSIAEALRST